MTLIFSVIMFFNLITGNPASGQIIDNRLGNAFREEMYFNQEFLWQNKIVSVSVGTAIKRTGRPIEQKPDILVYHFNEVGLLEKIDKVSSVLSLVDSLTISFRRNDLGDIELRSEGNKRGVKTTRLNYDDQGKLIRLDYGSEVMTSPVSTDSVANATVVNSESFTYSDAGPGSERRSLFNNYGLLYSNEVVTRNELGYVVSITEELLMSNKITTRVYQYLDKGWVGQITTSDNTGSPARNEKFYYDEIGNLLKVEYYVADKLIREVEVLYTDRMLIEATLDHDLQSHDIVIHKYSYQIRS